MAKFGEYAAQEDLDRVLVFHAAIMSAASATGMRACVLAGIVSRETRGAPRFFTGDNGHGHGPMQIDDRYHNTLCEAYKAGNLDNAAMILESAKILSSMFPSFVDLGPAQETAAIAAYNAGSRAVHRGLDETGDPDEHTTGGNYSHDVLERAAFFDAHGFSEVFCEP